jgi:16S rRNA (guanine527-N7)-methyltransferase
VPIIILFRYALPLVKDKAFIVAMKGGDLDEEFQKAELKYKSFIKKSTVYELAYKPYKLKKQKREEVSRY